jgi:hypothetical protein
MRYAGTWERTDNGKKKVVRGHYSYCSTTNSYKIILEDGKEIGVMKKVPVWGKWVLVESKEDPLLV